MELKNFLIGVLLAVGLASCSSDNLSDSGTDSPEIGQGENYISVSIEMPASAGSRTSTDDGLFDDGTDEESKVNNIVFFFFDDNGVCVDVQKIDNIDSSVFQKPDQPSNNPNITKFGTVEVRLKAGLTYSKVGVALNSPAKNATDLKSKINSIEDFLERTYDYIKDVDGSGQVMSNSVYFDMKDNNSNPIGSTKPDNKYKIDVISITDKNKYTSAEKQNIDNLIESGEKEYVKIYVERVLAKVNVKASLNMNDYYVIEENDDQGNKVKKFTITLFDHVNSTSKEITVRPVIKGMILNVLAPKTALVKPINIDDVGYDKGDGDYKKFQWNDPANKRSYWATTELLDETTMTYHSWNDAVARGSDDFSEYIHPNTQAFKPIDTNDRRSLSTKIMVVAQLHRVNADGDTEEALDFVKFGSDYMLSSDFLSHVARLVNRDIYNIDWDNVTFGDVSLTQDQRDEIKTAVSNAFSEDNGYKKNAFLLDIAETTNDDQYGSEDWAAKVGFKTGVDMPSITGCPSDLLQAVTKVISETRKTTLENINKTPIMYWHDGCTYFYTTIRHQGFTGLPGGGDSNFLYGVVRNHIYNVTLTGVYGLGTPVIDPDKPINPDRPGDERPSYIKARINILPWRVVTYNATIH